MQQISTLISPVCVFFFPPITSHASFSRCIGSVNKYWAGMASLKKKKKVLLIIQMTTLNHTAISVFIA